MSETPDVNRRRFFGAAAAAVAAGPPGLLALSGNTAISSARLYWDTRQVSKGGGFFDVRGVKLPVGVSAFADEIYQAPRSWAEKAYPKLVYYKSHAAGSHFAAWEQPELFVEDVRASFKPLRV
jgi:hypothetical protein